MRVELAVPEAIVGDAERAACEALLGSEERARAARLRAPGARQRFVVAQALARRALSRAAAEVPPEAWQFRRGPHGKPEIAAPAAHSSLRFNLSHTEGLVACAVLRDLDVGVDVEAGARLGDPLRLAERFFAAAETAWLRALPPEERRARFLDLWSLKEAVLKALGIGLAGSIGGVAFELEGGAPRLARAGGPAGEPRDWQLALLRPTPRHRLALAIRRGARADLRLELLPAALAADAAASGRG